MGSRIRVIALVGAGAITSAGICSLYLAYSLNAAMDSPFDEGRETLQSAPRAEAALEKSEPEVGSKVDESGAPKVEQGFLVAFLADANPQVRTLAAWGLTSSEETEDRQRELLEFIREERDPEVRVALYRFLQGQRGIRDATLVELVGREKEENQTWLASCDLLASAVQNGASPEAEEFFNGTIVPKLQKSALNGSDLHCRIAAIIALHRAGTEEALEALRQIIRVSTDPQVVQTASSAVRLVAVE